MSLDKTKLITPAYLSLVTTTLQLVALPYIPASIYQMLRGGTIACKACIIGVQHRKLMRHQYLGILLCLAGLVVVGLFSYPTVK